MARDTIVKRLIYLHDKEGMTWRKIAKMKEYRGIPAGTLCSISKGYWPKDVVILRKLGVSKPELIEQYRDELGRFA
jgi:hypothetical protein